MKIIVCIAIVLFIIFIVFLMYCIVRCCGKYNQNCEKQNEYKQYLEKKDMCLKVVQSGNCPHCCNICAWNVGGQDNE